VKPFFNAGQLSVKQEPLSDDISSIFVRSEPDEHRLLANAEADARKDKAEILKLRMEIWALKRAWRSTRAKIVEASGMQWIHVS
jgi:hypothetical protein